MVLATRTSRNLFAAYCLALHLLVFMVLYWLGTADFEQHAVGSLGKVGTAAVKPVVEALAGADGQTGDWHQESFKSTQAS
jgi:homeobox protein cut-like